MLVDSPANQTQEVKQNQKEDIHPLVVELQSSILGYLQKRPHMTINSLSARCQVSEPTLRRIAKGQVKTLPKAKTVLDILCVIHGENRIDEIIKKHPGSIGQFLENHFSSYNQVVHDQKINHALKDPTVFLIYSLCANHMGTTENHIKDMFGQYGVQKLGHLLENDLIYEHDGVFYSKADNFTYDHSSFVQNFKSLADFIKTDALGINNSINPLFSTTTYGINEEAYKKIRLIMGEAIAECRDFMVSSEAKGDIPVFLLGAFDTLSSKTVAGQKK